MLKHQNFCLLYVHIMRKNIPVLDRFIRLDFIVRRHSTNLYFRDTSQIPIFSFQWRFFNFLNVMKMRPNMTNATIREVLACHLS